jgi:recombination protein RecR
MENFSKDMTNLIASLNNLPGIGLRSATRLAFHIVNADKNQMLNLAENIKNACNNIRRCSKCFMITDGDLCSICKNEKRNHKQIMVVENEQGIAAYENTKEYLGVYHVLGGALDPLKGIGPSQLKIKELVDRVVKDGAEEVIIATNSSQEGDLTASYLIKILKDYDVKISKIASGVPFGGDIENIDAMTLTRALEGRTEI